MTPFTRSLFFILFLLGTAWPQNAETPDQLGALMDRLLTGDRRVIPELLEQPEAALALFEQRTAPAEKNITPLLLQLGAESYQEREQATTALRKLGEPIREQVLIFMDENRGDPEIVKRCKQILNRLAVMDQSPAQDVAIVKFLVNYPELDPTLIHSQQARYQRIFETEDTAFIQNGGKMENLEEFYAFTRQYLQISGTRDAYMKWLLVDAYKDRTLGTVRMLLNHDFDTYYPIVAQKNRYSREINKIIDDSFAHKMGDKEKLVKLKSKYDGSRHPKEVEWNLNEPLTPLLAFHILNRKGMNNLEDSEYDLLFEKLAPMPKAELMGLLNEKPIEGMFLRQITIRRPDLNQELTAYILEKTNEIDYIWLWDVYFMALVDEIKYEQETGEFDDAWLRIFEANEGSPRVLSWRVNKLKLSPERVLAAFKKYPEKVEEAFDYNISAFEYLLKNGNPDFQMQTVNFILTVCEEEKLHSSQVRTLWYALFSGSEPNSPALLDKKFEVMAKLKSQDDSHFLSEDLNRTRYSENDQTLTEFYLLNQPYLDQKLSEPPLSTGEFQMACLLTRNQDLPPKSKSMLAKSLKTSLETQELSAKALQACLVAGMNLGGILHPSWFDHLLDLVSTADQDPFDFPIWQLDAAYEPLLPQLQKRLETPGSPTASLLCLGFMISPDHPDWRPYLEEQLRDSPSTRDIAYLIRALKIVNREPDLSKLTDERLSMLFDVSDDEVYEETSSLFSTLYRKDNRKLALQYLQPQLTELITRGGNTHQLGDLYYRTPDSWEFLGETLLSIMESDDMEAAEKAAGNLTSLDTLPVSAMNRLGAILSRSSFPQRGKDNLLWSIAKIGSPDAALSETVRNLPASEERMEIRKAFALSAISPDEDERRANLEFIMEKYQADPDQYTLRQIGLIQGFDQERLAFFRELLEEGYTETEKKISYYNLNEIVYRLTDFSDPEIAATEYKRILSRLADPELPQPKMLALINPLLGRLVLFYPDRLPEFKPYVEALPGNKKISWEYRFFTERAGPE